MKICTEEYHNRKKAHKKKPQIRVRSQLVKFGSSFNRCEQHIRVDE